MADKAAPTGSKVSGQVRVASQSSAGPIAGAIGTSRTVLPRKGGNPKAPNASLISGAQATGKKGGD